MATKSDKMQKVISEAERLDAAVESLVDRVSDAADLFEQIVGRFGELSHIRKQMETKIPQG